MTFSAELRAATESDRQQLLSAPIITDCLSGHVSREGYRAFLTEAYHHVKHTVPLLMACGARLPERLEWLRQAIAHYIDEEVGHEHWILNDLAACGADPNAVRADGGCFETRLMVAYAYHAIDRGNPVANVTNPVPTQNRHVPQDLPHEMTRNVLSGHHGLNAGDVPCRRGIHAADAGVGMGTAQNLAPKHAR